MLYHSAMTIEVTIEALGARGDGIAHHDGTKLFVPGTLPGERVRVALPTRGSHAKLVERLSKAPSRKTPSCSYFGVCGGCVAQHMADKTYSEWKRTIIREALTHHGFHDVSIAPAIASPPASRRRVRLAVAQPSNKFRGIPKIGFRCRSSHRIATIEHCPVMLPELESLLAPLSRLVAEIGAGFGDLSLTAAPEGRDVILHGLKDTPNLAIREALAEFAHVENIQRISVEYSKSAGGGQRRHGRANQRNHHATPVLETIAQLGAVRTHFDAVAVDLPLGAFLQPTAAGEATIRRLVIDALKFGDGPSGESSRGGADNGTGARIADCYAGLGSLGFAIAADRRSEPPHRQVVMYEGNLRMAEAARKAAGEAAHNVVVESRDLVRRPLAPTELNLFDAVIFDPPRAGARALVEALAASKVQSVVAVSCNPATFARDARILNDAGYCLAQLTPIDQFLWSHHVELVAVFRRF